MTRFLLGDDVLLALISSQASVNGPLANFAKFCAAPTNYGPAVICMTWAARAYVEATVRVNGKNVHREALRNYTLTIEGSGSFFEYSSAISMRYAELLVAREEMYEKLEAGTLQLRNEPKRVSSRKEPGVVHEDELYQYATADQHSLLYVTEVTPALRLFHQLTHGCTLYDPWADERVGD